MTAREQIRRDSPSIERDVVTVRGFIDYPTASGRDVYLRAVEALDRLALDAHRAEQAERERDEARAELAEWTFTDWDKRVKELEAQLEQAERERDEAREELATTLEHLGRTNDARIQAERELRKISEARGNVDQMIVVKQIAREALAVWKQAQR